MESTVVKKKRSASQALLFLAIPFAILFVSSHTQTCPVNGIEAGVEPLPRPSSTTPSEHFLLTGKGVINCKGVIREWVFYTNQDCSTGAATIVFEVWRPLPPGSLNYELVGMNTFSSAYCASPTARLVTFGIAPVDRIPVEPGYTIGWYQNINALEISYDTVPDPTSFYHNRSGALLSLGGSGSFQSAAQLRDFSLKVAVLQGDYPTLDNLPSSVNVTENVPSSSLVFTVFASHICNKAYPNAVQLTFSLTPTTSVPFSLTSVINGEGQVKTTATINYEVQNIYQLSVTVTGLGLSTTEVLTVYVNDINEAHGFVNLAATINVPAASTSAGDQVFLVRISDPDVIPVYPIKFYIQSWSSTSTSKDIPPFSINPDTGSVTASVDLSDWYLQYPTNPSLYPISVTYTLNILATDGVFNPTNSLTVTIANVKQPPVFLNLPVTTTVDENIPGNGVVYQVLVAPSSDPILRFQLTTAVTPFCINELNGVISLCSYAKLDYCNTTQYNVSVTATNSALSSNSSLTVDLRKVNAAPTFTPSFYIGSVNEKCKPTGSCMPPVSVISIIVTDPDLFCPSNADLLSCSVVLGPGSQFFDVVNCQTVRNILPIDVDSDPAYETITLLVEAKDLGNLATFATVKVSVININDYSPNFTQPVYYGSVQENSPGGTAVLSVAATDDDRGINGELLYSISASDPLHLYFQVDPRSGLITTKQPLNFENLSTALPLRLTVWATDRGTPSRNDSAVVTIDVLDVNDVRPEIDCSNRPSDEPYPPLPCFCNFDLKHDALPNSNVSDLLLFADDVDPQPNVISFGQLVQDEHFSMNRSNCLITVAKTVESYTKYVLYVYAEDNGSPRLKSRIMYIRIDTYRPDRHWIDMTVRPETMPFNVDAFLAAMRNVTYPWFMKMVAVTNYDPNVQKDIAITVYALADDSTYFPENIANQKIFVERDELLKKLRKNIYGDPEEILRGPLFEGNWKVIKVMPSYVNWWTDTVEGIATIVCLSAIAVIFTAAVAVAICKGSQTLCFKPAPAQSLMSGGGTNASKPPAPFQKSNEDNVRYRSARERRASVLTVHSAIE